MITRDFLLRQIHQLVQALATVFFHKRAEQYGQAQEVLTEAVEETLGLPLDQLRQLPREDVLALCATGSAFSPEKAVALADLLREDEAAAGRERALWLYEAALDSGGTVPFDVHERMAALRTPEEGRE